MGDADRNNRTIVIVMRQLLELRGKGEHTYLGRDRVMELYAPVALIALLVVWLFSINLGYIAMDWAIDVQSWYKALNPLFGAVSQLPPHSRPARIHMSGSQYFRVDMSAVRLDTYKIGNTPGLCLKEKSLPGQIKSYELSRWLGQHS